MHLLLIIFVVWQRDSALRGDLIRGSVDSTFAVFQCVHIRSLPPFTSTRTFSPAASPANPWALSQTGLVPAHPPSPVTHCLWSEWSSESTGQNFGASCTGIPEVRAGPVLVHEVPLQALCGEPIQGYESEKRQQEPTAALPSLNQAGRAGLARGTSSMPWGARQNGSIPVRSCPEDRVEGPAPGQRRL